MKIKTEANGSGKLFVSTFIVGDNVIVQVLHTSDNKGISWDYPIKPNGMPTTGIEKVLSQFTWED